MQQVGIVSGRSALFRAEVFVVPVEKVYRIRTGEEDNAAVTPSKTAGAEAS